MTILLLGIPLFCGIPLFWQWEIHYKTHLSAGKTNRLKNFAMDVWLKHCPSWKYPLLMFYIMIWNPPTKNVAPFFFQTSWKHLGMCRSSWRNGRNARPVGPLGRAKPTLKSWISLSEASDSQHFEAEFVNDLLLKKWILNNFEILDFKMYSQHFASSCVLFAPKKKDTTNVFQLVTSRHTTEKKKKTSLRWVRFEPSSFSVAMETSRCFPNEHARRRKHIPNTNAKETHLSWMQYAAESRPPTKNTCRNGSALHITRTWTVLSSAGSSAWLLALSKLAFYCSNSVAENGHTLW